MTEVLRLVSECARARLLILCNSDVSGVWDLPQDLARHTLLPLLQTQRRLAVGRLLDLEPSHLEIGIGIAAENAAVFSMALQAGIKEDYEEEIVDKWISTVASAAVDTEKLEEHGLDSIKATASSERKASLALDDLDAGNVPLLARSVKVQQLLAARHLSHCPPDIAVDLWSKAPSTWQPVLRSTLHRLGKTPEGRRLVEALIASTGPDAQRGALLVSDLPIADSAIYGERIKQGMVELIKRATLPLQLRVKAGRLLSRLGDPRDLQTLAHIPAGTFSMGSNTHPNSQAIHTVSTEAFQIGVFPVVNAHYLDFNQATSRPWHSPSANMPETLNHPATDLTWHDANAYCIWLTSRWHQSGTISQDERVRLPTEAEWERAARGDQVEKDSSKSTYPWGGAWQFDASNSEEAGLNAPCAVGLFPGYGSQFGCRDMVGQVWKWCSTLWGEDMCTRSFSYPYLGDDGREATEAPPTVRRVLRGGCFSSGALKATCAYRGSLEPAGYWRGNGFRIVVA